MDEYMYFASKRLQVAMSAWIPDAIAERGGHNVLMVCEPPEAVATARHGVLKRSLRRAHVLNTFDILRMEDSHSHSPFGPYNSRCVAETDIL